MITYVFVHHSTDSQLTKNAEYQQHHRPSPSIPAQEAGWIPLGLFSPGLHNIRRGYSGSPNAKRPCTTGNHSICLKVVTASAKEPVHTDSLTVCKTDRKIVSTSEGEDTEIRRPIVTAVAIVEQRLSNLSMGLALIGTMTGPLLIVLHTMPSALFAGVFFVVGVRLPLCCSLQLV